MRGERGPADGVGRRQVLLGGALGAAAAFAGRPAAGATGAGAEDWDFAEHRSPARLVADGRLAGRQVEALSSPSARERAGQVADRLRERAEAAPGGDGVPFDRYPSSGAEVLVARGQLCVPVDAGPAPVALGYTPVRGASVLPSAPGAGVEVFRGDKWPAQLVRDVATLRARGVSAGLNLVVPLGHTIKADDHPVVTEGLPPRPRTAPGRARVRVALVDTGVAAERRGDGWLDGVVADPGHLDPLDVLPPLGRLDWGSGHGTFTAGIVRQVAPRCEIVAYRFARGDGLGTEKDVADLLLLAAQEAHRAGIPTVVNASLGTPAVDGVPPLAMREAVELITARYPGVLIVASAGNLGTAEPVYPAAFDGVVAVGAVTHDLRPAPFSSHGAWVTCSAVGVGVVSTFVRGIGPPEPDPVHPDQVFGADPWAMWSGTSFSAPQISGAIARRCQEDPALTPRAALATLLSGRPALPGLGPVVRLLPGTPTS